MRDTKARTLMRALLVAVSIAYFGLTVDAHKPVTSPYTYNEHVFPILRDHCGSCHVEGGAAPMSLLAYTDSSGGAYAWAQAIREMLVSEAMPPWYADARGPAVEHAHTLTSRELDIIVTWASGGAPEGDPTRRPAPLTSHAQWALGKPDLILRMPAAHDVDAKTPEETFDITLPANNTTARWIRAADVLPGTPSMVRRAQISIVDGPVLAVWEPGDDVAVAPVGTAFQLPAAAAIHLQILYKKSWKEEQEDKTDQSSVGLYFSNGPVSPRRIGALVADGPASNGSAPVSFRATIGRASRVLAIRPQLDRPYASMTVTAVTASGGRVPLLQLRAARPEWPRRYWLRTPVDVPVGASIEVTGIPGDPEDRQSASRVALPLQVALDIVPQ
jgi:hypothetical protein